MKINNRNARSIKWKVFFYMLIFAAMLILVLWFCQTVYLESFYKSIKEHEVKQALNALTEELSEEDTDIEECLNETASEHELCILLTDAEGNECYSAENSFGCTIHMLTMEQLSTYYYKAKENENMLIFTSDEEMKKSVEKERHIDETNPWENEMQPKGWMKDSVFSIGQEMVSGSALEGNWGELPPPQPFDKNPIEDNLIEAMKGGRESMVCATVQTIDGNDYLVLVDVRLTPVDATVNTLRVQLVIISFIMIILALVMAFLISRAVSKPIIMVNDSAKELAKGNYSVVFNGRSYREISELSDTLNYTSRELAKTEKYQQELIANVSHDLRTPLTMITAYSEVMRDLPGENTPENIQVIIEETERLTNLVNDMLDISKLQSGVLEKEAKVYDLTESIERVMERYVKLKEQEHYNITFEYDRHVLVEADEFKIFQVLYNLINNAINYTGEDKTVIVRQLIKENKVRIEVEDTGVGIPESELANVWERYYKASTGTNHKRAIKGTGLGLSIVKNILKLHQATYGVDSETGKGSTFWFELDCLNEK